MPNTKIDFVDQQTVITEEWLDQVETTVHDVLDDAVTKAEARTALDVPATAHTHTLAQITDKGDFEGKQRGATLREDAGILNIDIQGQASEANPSDEEFLVRRPSDGGFRKVAITNLPNVIDQPIIILSGTENLPAEIDVGEQFDVTVPVIDVTVANHRPLDVATTSNADIRPISQVITGNDTMSVTCLNVGAAKTGFSGTVTAYARTKTGGSGGVTDHGGLTGLTDNDHPQYQKDGDLIAATPVNSAASGAQTQAVTLNNVAIIEYEWLNAASIKYNITLAASAGFERIRTIRHVNTSGAAQTISFYDAAGTTPLNILGTEDTGWNVVAAGAEKDFTIIRDADTGVISVDSEGLPDLTADDITETASSKIMTADERTKVGQMVPADFVTQAEYDGGPKDPVLYFIIS